MILSSTLQNAYNKMYVALREYIWPFDIVEQLSELEIATYQRFPDLKEVERKFNKLVNSVSYTDPYREDEGIRECFDDFRDILNTSEEVYYDITSFKEVTENEDTEVQL